ncbi:MAG: hypothetical protein ACK559_13380, partial [bacterium]
MSTIEILPGPGQLFRKCRLRLRQRGQLPLERIQLRRQGGHTPRRSPPAPQVGWKERTLVGLGQHHLPHEGPQVVPLGHQFVRQLPQQRGRDGRI